MKTLKLLFISLLFASCTPDSTTEPIGDTCTKSYYTYKVIRYQGGAFVWGYELDYSEPTTQASTGGQYVRIEGETYYKIECE